MFHSEINNRKDAPMRFIQMWFIPSTRGLEPSVEQKPVEKAERTNRLLPLVSNKHRDALRIISDAEVYSCFLQKRKTVKHQIEEGRGAYLYVVEGGPIQVNGHKAVALAAAKATGKQDVNVTADEDAELLLVDVLLS
jgi:redox-sensitive bicupin YhaK (pirin superfamily)